MPKGVIDVQLQQLAHRIPYFRDIFMHTTLPIEGVCQNESDIVNLDNAKEPGTHQRMRKEGIALCTLTVSAMFDRRRNMNDIWQIV